jgi:hypothetical protein
MLRHVSETANPIKTTNHTYHIELCNFYLSAILSKYSLMKESAKYYYDSQNYWVLGLWPSSGNLKFREHNVPETGSVSVLRSRGRHLLCWMP